MELQGKSLKIGEMEARLSTSLNRNQIKYLLEKLVEDSVVASEGRKRGTKYLIIPPFDTFRGHALVGEVSNYLRVTYE